MKNKTPCALFRKFFLGMLCIGMLPSSQGGIYHLLSSDKTGVWRIRGDHGNRADVTVPHIMNRYGQGYDTDFTSTVFTYTRDFDVPGEIFKQPNKFLRFERANFRTTVWVNGKKVGMHEGAHHAFEMDVGGALHAGRNKLKVMVEDYHCLLNGRNNRLLGLVGFQTTWDYCRGIYDDVYLVGRGGVHLGEYYTWGIVRGADGPTAKDPADIHARTTVVNTTSDSTRVVVTYAYSLNGKLAKTLSSGVLLVPAHASRSFDMQQPWKHPALWWPDAPSLYDVTVTVRADGKVMDRETFQFGFRDVYTRKTNLETYKDDQGRVIGDIWLNGKRIRLFMDCWFLDAWANKRHFLKMWEGDEAHIESMFRMAKAHNINSLRLHMDAWPKKILKVADRVGMMLVYEAPFTSHAPVGFDASGRIPKPRNKKYYYDFKNPAFWEKAAWQVERMVKDVRQHPSVVLWCAGNEVRRMVHPMTLKKDPDFNRNLAGMADIYLRLDPARDVLFSGDHENLHPYNPRLFIVDHHYTNGMHFGNRTELPNIAPWAGSASGEVDWNEIGTNWDALSEDRIRELRNPTGKAHALMKRMGGEPARRGNRYPFFMGEYFYAGNYRRGRARLFGGFRSAGKRDAQHRADAKVAYHQTMNFRTFRNWDAFGFFTVFAPVGDKALHAAVKEAFRPCVAYCSNYSDAFFEGREFERHFVIMNDTPRRAAFSLEIKLLDAGRRVFFEKQKRFDLEAGDLARWALTLQAPDCATGDRFFLQYNLLEGGGVVDANVREYHVFPKEKLTVRRPVFFLEGHRDLKALSMCIDGAMTSIDAMEQLSRKKGVFVIAEKDMRKSYEDPMRRFLDKGGRVLYLATSPEIRDVPSWFGCPLEVPLTFRKRTYAYTLAFKDPQCTGRFAEAVIDSDFLSTPVNRSEPYGDLRYWGRDNLIAEKSIAMITHPGFRPMVRAADGQHDDMRNVLLADIRVGKGVVTYCTLLVLEKYQDCPPARKVLEILLDG